VKLQWQHKKVKHHITIKYNNTKIAKKHL